MEHIGLKTTRIRSLSGEELVLSNEDLLSSRIRNYKKLQQRRVFLSFGLAQENDNEKLGEVRSIVKKIVDDHPLTRYDRAYFKDFSPSASRKRVFASPTPPGVWSSRTSRASRPGPTDPPAAS